MASPLLDFCTSYMRSIVPGTLGSLLLSTVVVVCLCYIVRQKFLTGTSYIPWLWMIYLCSMVEPPEITGPLYIQCIHMGYLCTLKILMGLIGSP